MKKMSRSVWMLVVVVSVFFLLQACATQTAQIKPDTGGTYAQGKYVNKSPAFSIQFPADWEPQKLQSTEIFRVANPNAWKIPVATVTIGDKTKDAAPLKDKAAAQGYLEGLKKTNPASSRHRILSREVVTLSDGTPALTLIIKWKFDQTTVLVTAALMAYKGDKVVSLSNSTVAGGATPPDKLLATLKTLTFR